MKKKMPKWGPGGRTASPAQVKEFEPLVKALARELENEHVSRDDLGQEGMMILAWLIPLCRKKKWLAAFVRRWLRVYMIRAAVRLGRILEHPETLEADDEAHAVADARTEFDLQLLELKTLLERHLTPREYALVLLLWQKGYTQQEAADAMGVSRRTIYVWLCEIRRKLKPYFYPDEYYPGRPPKIWC